MIKKIYKIVASGFRIFGFFCKKRQKNYKIISRCRKSGNITIELLPSRRTLFFEGTPYFVSLPKLRLILNCWKYRGYNVDNVELWFVNSSDQYVVPYLPNVNQEMHLCCPHARHCKTLEEAIEKQIECIFSSSFNVDDTRAVSRYYPHLVPSYDCNLSKKLQWKNLTKEFHLHFQNWSKKTKDDLQWIPDDFVEAHT